MRDPNQPYPLEGLRVLDFSRVLAGPFAGRLLNDLGADVVKIEPPDGDITRLWGRVVGGVPGYFHQQNAGKRNICIDLRAHGARDLVLSLVREADIVIENYRPDVMPRLGFGYDALSGENPQLIMLSISGFGSGGPESHKGAYAPVIHAEAGLLGRAAKRSGLPPRDLPLSVADTNASLHGLVALLSAVILRHRTGRGQHIDMAMLDATLATDDQMQFDIDASAVTGPLPNEIFDTKAGPILVSADARWLWRLLTQRLGVQDPDTGTMPFDQKLATRRRIITDFFAGLETFEEIEKTLAEVNLAWGRVRDPETIGTQPTVHSRGAIVDVDDRAGSTRPTIQSPYRFSHASSGVRGGAAHRGEHNTNVLSDWLGMAPAMIQTLQDGGVLLHEEPTQ